MTVLALEVKDLSVAVPHADGPRSVIDDVSFFVESGHIVGIVGESGSGKTMSALAVADLLPTGSSVHGTVRLGGLSLLDMTPSERDAQRGTGVAVVFQDPVASLNPVFTVRKQLLRVLRAHRGLTGGEAVTVARELLTAVGLTQSDQVLRSYAHQLSGGMCQRVMIALALACRPQLLIADEPTTALDVTVQAEIISLLQRLAEDEDLAILFISHDLGVVSRLCTSIVVLYAGQVVESGSAQQILRAPQHPYTRALIECIPDLDEIGVTRAGIPGKPPEPGSAPSGCRFRDRCAFATAGCEKPQPLVEDGAGHTVRCWRAGDLPDAVHAV